MALMELGEFDQAMEVLQEAVGLAEGAGDAVLAARARLVICYVELYSGDAEDWSESTARQIDTALPIFEEANDEIGQTLAWRLRSGL
ncbi:MAG: hypothetical protein ACXU8U_11345, partial [Asticcacaulis sp.]